MIECIQTMVLTEYNFPGGFKEIVIHDKIENKEGNKTGRKGNKADNVDIKQREINICRIKKKLRRYAMINELHRMLTLTTKENIQDIEVIDYYFKRFIEDLRRKYPKYKDVKYLGTREKQKRGAIHLHILVDSYLPQEDLLKIWLNIVGAGSVNIVYKDYKAINYVVKYIEKQLNEYNFTTKKGQSKKAYFMSRNLDKNINDYKKEFFYQVIRYKDGSQKLFKNGEFINIIEEEIKEYEKVEKILYDKVTEYLIKGVKHRCRSVLIKVA